MDFCKYKEHNAENLQIFLWYKDFESRWTTLPESEKALAPEWTTQKAEVERLAYREQTRNKPSRGPGAEILNGTDFASSKNTSQASDEKEGPFCDAMRVETSHSDTRLLTADTQFRPQSSRPSERSGYSQRAGTAFEDAGLAKPCKFPTVE